MPEPEHLDGWIRSGSTLRGGCGGQFGSRKASACSSTNFRVPNMTVFLAQVSQDAQISLSRRWHGEVPTVIFSVFSCTLGSYAIL